MSALGSSSHCLPITPRWDHLVAGKQAQGSHWFCITVSLSLLHYIAQCNNNKVHNKCNALESPLFPWKNCLPENRSLVPKKIGAHCFKRHQRVVSLFLSLVLSSHTTHQGSAVWGLREKAAIHNSSLKENWPRWSLIWDSKPLEYEENRCLSFKSLSLLSDGSLSRWELPKWRYC